MIPVTHIAESYEHKELLKNKLLEVSRGIFTRWYMEKLPIY
ncbi:hypothetical protein [Rickettsia amblyommatis]|uniref:Uncharacterized protein n=1 Tax=Rickettsia amblyommatis str. Ac/Pa TaxID=1359164 RepID=A0A0F3N1M6_RICAM|nr:hypothetical protein [Rickettsia amblyommatis]KJV61582.1 hypothetical protein APHACPA_0592 [Rickettsia amblyommatis str. Ac/Pa]